MRACGIAKNCNPNVWFGHVEKYCLKSKKPLYGTRSVCDIHRNHVTDSIKHKLPKYKNYYNIIKPTPLIAPS